MVTTNRPSTNEPAPKPRRRLGFAEGKWEVPDDFDTISQKEIEEMFQSSDIIFEHAP